MMEFQFYFTGAFYLCFIFNFSIGIHTDYLVIQVNGNETTARQLEQDYSLIYVRKIFKDQHFYQFQIPGMKNVPLESSLLSALNEDGRIIWVEQQIKRTRQIRRILNENMIYKHTNKEKLKSRTRISHTIQQIRFNDPYYPYQWYLHNDGQTSGIKGNDLNVVAAWKAGFTGRGVTLSVLDDGIQHTNLDIQANYDPSISYDLVDRNDANHDPTPDLNGDNSHGTYCAAIIAAVANNSICGVGIAYNAKVGGLRLMDGKVTDLQEALALTYGLNKVDVYSASWGPKDDGKHMAGPGKLTAQALKEGIKFGRQGKGVIYVWAVGNGGLKKDNCNMDGYVNSIYTVAISALTSEGLSAYYSEPCACTLTSTFVGGLHKPTLKDLKAILKDMRTVKVVVPELDGTCTESFQGTSAAAPLAAGVIALAIEANPSLTWRDIQHLLVHSSRIPNAKEDGWKINGAGHHFHLSYGFGVMDAGRMVAIAQKWQLVKPQQKKTVISYKVPRNIHCESNLTSVIENNGNPGQSVTRLEHVLITVDIIHPSRRHLTVFLQSPSGTLSQQLTYRPLDDSKKGIRMWTFMSVHFWDENPLGPWTLIISDRTPCSGKIGILKYFSLTFYGTFSNSRGKKTIFRGHHKAYIPNYATIHRMMEMEKLKSQYSQIVKKQFT